MNFEKFVGARPEKPFRLFFWRFLFGYLPFGLLTSLMALLEVNPVIFNDEPVAGIKGFIIGTLMIPFIVLAITIMVWLLFVIGDAIIKLMVRHGGDN